MITPAQELYKDEIRFAKGIYDQYRQAYEMNIVYDVEVDDLTFLINNAILALSNMKNMGRIQDFNLKTAYFSVPSLQPENQGQNTGCAQIQADIVRNNDSGPMATVYFNKRDEASLSEFLIGAVTSIPYLQEFADQENHDPIKPLSDKEINGLWGDDNYDDEVPLP